MNLEARLRQLEQSVPDEVQAFSITVTASGNFLEDQETPLPTHLAEGASLYPYLLPTLRQYHRIAQKELRAGRNPRSAFGSEVMCFGKKEDGSAGLIVILHPKELR